MDILKNAESIKKFLDVCESGDPLKDFYDEDDLARALITLIHRTTPTDDNSELLTHEWLTSIGFSLSAYKTTDNYGWFQFGVLDYYYVPPTYSNIVIRIVNHKLTHIRTRGQLRRLIESITGKDGA